MSRGWGLLSLPPCPPPRPAVYTLVRFAKVHNWVAATYSPEDLAACLDLNLPCWDVER